LSTVTLYTDGEGCCPLLRLLVPRRWFWKAGIGAPPDTHP